jgi:putative sigma-54 modulation protein
MSRRSKAAEFLDDVYNITVTGRNVVVTDAMKDYVMEKLSKIDKFSNRIIDAVVTMDVQKYEQRVDIVLKVNQIKIKAQAVSEDMYTSIDKAVHKIEAQLLKYKNKLQDHQTKNISAIDMKVNVLRTASEQELLDLNDEIESETKFRLMDKYHPHKIVSKTTRSLKMLTDGEAMMKMELSEDPFLIYRCEETRKIKIIYRRKDGDFGVIQPEDS